MALPWIEMARNSLRAASNNYADVQRQLDRYNKVFDTYSKASPETQMRAAAVMRQAINEYNNLKRQQEENTLRIYEAQEWVDFYKKSTPNYQPQQTSSPIIENANNEVNNTTYIPTTPINYTNTPWRLNNITPTINTELNAIDTDTTADVTIPAVINNAASPTSQVWATDIVKYQPPRYANVVTNQVNNSWNNTPRVGYWPGNVISMPWTWWLMGIPSFTTTRRAWNKYIPIIKKALTGIYNYLKK